MKELEILLPFFPKVGWQPVFERKDEWKRKNICRKASHMRVSVAERLAGSLREYEL